MPSKEVKKSKIRKKLEISGIEEGIMTIMREEKSLVAGRVLIDSGDPTVMPFRLAKKMENVDLLYFAELEAAKETVMDKLAEEYNKIFSESEIDEIIRFYSSRAGEIFAKSDPVIQQAAKKIAEKHIDMIVAKLREKRSEILAAEA